MRVGLAAAVLILVVPAGARGQEMAMAMEDRAVLGYLSFDELELQTGPEELPVEFDALGWIGGDVHRAWVKARGEQATRTGAGEIEGQLLYGRVISPYWDLQAGVRVDSSYGDEEDHTRALVGVGLQGLAPYWFEVESAVFLSQNGDLSARLQASYELLFTQRVILEPEVQLDLAAQDVPEVGVERGISALELGARLRYEIVRELAPYVGISWIRRPGGLDESSDPSASFVAGLRWWY